MVGIPIGEKITVTLSATRAKHVTCEHCGAEFVYEMKRKAEGAGSNILFLNKDGATRRAAESAEKSLQKQLENEIDPVPCPKCAAYQRNMFRSVRLVYGAWIWVLAILTYVVLGVGSLVNLFTDDGYKGPAVRWSLVGYIALAPIGLLLIRWVMSYVAYDPNTLSEIDRRRKIAEARCQLRADYERQLVNPEKQTKTER